MEKAVSLMIYGFVQDSPVIESFKQQRESILSYAKSHALSVDEWLDSTTFDPEKFKEKDVLLLEKTFRLGKEIRSISEILQQLLSKGVKVCSCKDNITFGEDYVSSTVMAHAFGLVANIAEEVRSALTKEALALRKREGQTLGRPRGRKNTSQKWDAKKEQIRKLLLSGKTEPEICRMLNIPRSSLFVYVKDHPELKPEAI